MISTLKRHLVPFVIFGGLAVYGYAFDGLNDGAFTMPSVSGTYTQMANEAALRNALFPNQKNAFIMKAML